MYYTLSWPFVQLFFLPVNRGPRMSLIKLREYYRWLSLQPVLSTSKTHVYFLLPFWHLGMGGIRPILRTAARNVSTSFLISPFAIRA